MSEKRQKVAILGGGVGSVVAAYQLTRTPELRARYDVTVYQLGWRLGGKGASGRNAAHDQRIEEHGLHLWLGFYDNASRVMRDCLGELDRSWGDAFIPCDDIALYADFGSGLHSWNFTLPRNAATPGDPATLPGFWEMARFGLGTLREAWEGLSCAHPHVPTLAPVGHLLAHWFDDAVESVLARLLGLGHDQPHHQLDAAIHLAEKAVELATGHGLERQFRSVVATLLRGFTNWMWDHVVKDHRDDANLCLFFTMVDTGAAILTGIVEDELIEKGFDAANDKELRDWLRGHGAHQITLDHGPLLKGLYDMAFAYEGGDIARPNASAGTAVHALLRLLFAYRGAFYWRMKAGMGDTVFAPFYEVLRRRGVHFQFFRCVTGLKLSGDRRFVEEITVVPQVDLTVGEYDPLVLVKGLPCWPSEPCWDQIAGGEQLRATGVNLEHETPPGREPVALRRETDFDLVVLGIPVGALEPLCGELMAGNPRFREMIEHSATTMTHGFQVWLNRPAEALGWRYGERSGATACAGAVSSYAPMTHLLGRENWPAADGVAHVGYFCGVLPDEPGDTQEGATKRAKEQAVTFLESQVRGVWPQTAGPGGHGFNWDVLVDPAGRPGPARFDAQFCVANFPATERYVLTTAGSVKHRLKTDESGFDNLYLAGDWVRTGLDSGCVEAAAMSGIQAAQAISGVPDVVVGEDHSWLCDGHAPPEVTPRHRFVEYGGLATWPTPVQCSSATLFGFALEADHDKLSALCRRVFAEPTGGEFDYRPLGSHVMLTFADVPHVTATRPPFSGKGYTTERQASLWIPVVKVRQEGPGLIVESLRWFVPLMWVDSPFSLTTGREVFGYPKNWGWLDFELPPPGQTPPRLLLEAFGGNLGQNEAAGRHPLIEVTRAPVSVPDDDRIPPRWPNLGAAVNSLKDVLLDGDESFVRPDLRLFAGLFDDFIHHQGPVQLFLKQFRSITGSPEPAVQQVVEAPVRITRLRARPVPVDHHVRVHFLQSHPLADDFGIEDQTTRLVVRADLDFVLEDGDVRWTAAERA